MGKKKTPPAAKKPRHGSVASAREMVKLLTIRASEGHADAADRIVKWLEAFPELAAKVEAAWAAAVRFEEDRERVVPRSQRILRVGSDNVLSLPRRARSCRPLARHTSGATAESRHAAATAATLLRHHPGRLLPLRLRLCNCADLLRCVLADNLEHLAGLRVEDVGPAR